MNLYNAEFFDSELNFRCSTQFGEFKYKFDYMDWEKSKITIKPVEVQMGDILLITGGGKRITGRVTETKLKKKEMIVNFKPFTERLDVDIFTSMEFEYVEDYIKDLIEAEYVYSGDNLQNINGLVVNALTHTEGKLDFEPGINNLYEITLKAFDAYQIVVDFHFEPGEMILYCDIFKNEADIINIEADLDNVFEKEINVLDYKEKTNKVTVYDKDNYTRHITYYMTKSGEITTNPDDNDRLLPVRDTAKDVSVKFYKEKAKTAGGTEFTINDCLNGAMEITDWAFNKMTVNGSSRTTNGITFTVSGGIITANGTATDDAIYYDSFQAIFKGNYAFSCVPKSFMPKGCYAFINGIERKDLGRGMTFYKQTPKPEKSKDDKETPEQQPETLGWGIVVEKGTVADNLVFKPMLSNDSTVRDYVSPYGYYATSTDDDGHSKTVFVDPRIDEEPEEDDEGNKIEFELDKLQCWEGYTRVYSDGYVGVKYPIAEEDDWKDKALKKATSTLKAAVFKNNITIYCAVDDKVIRPTELQVGQIVNVISKGVPYQTVLTGWEYKDGIKLQFGTLRFELTKILKKRWREENVNSY